MAEFKNSYLSTYSASLLTFPIRLADPYSFGLLDEFFIPFNDLDPSLINCLERGAYFDAMELAAPLIKHVGTSFMEYTEVELFLNYKQCLPWLSDVVEFFSLHRFCKSDNPVERVLFLLRLTALLECSLSQFSHTSSNGKHKHIMKDVLNSDGLRHSCGLNAVLLLGLFFGPVTSMNLRNLTWHGFVTPFDAASIDPCLFPFLLALLLSLGKHFNESSSFGPMKPSRLLSLPQFMDPVTNASFLANKPREVQNNVECHPLLRTCTRQYVDYIDWLLSEDSPRYLDMLLLSFICLSIVLRVNFVNCLSWADGMYSAEDRFFVTLDTILELNDSCNCPSFRLSVRRCEKFNGRIDTRIMSILCEVICSGHGPRLKDRLSHGELWMTRSIDCVGEKLEFDEPSRHFEYFALLMHSCLLALLSQSRRLSIDTPSWLRCYNIRYHSIAVFCKLVFQLENSHELIMTSSLLDESYSDENTSDILLCSKWFPNVDSVIKVSVPYPVETSDLWPIISVWSLVPEPVVSGTACKPNAILNRMLTVLQKYINASSLFHAFVEHIAALLKDELTSRQTNTLRNCLTAIPHWNRFIHALLKFVSLVWTFWLGGATELSLETRMRYIQSCASHCKFQQLKMLNFLDKTGDKMVMWIGSSRWECLTKFLVNITPPVPK